MLKIWYYIIYFVFERAWDFKTYLVLLGGAGVSVLAVIWVAYNVIRKRGFFSYVAPIAVVIMTLIALVAYRYRKTFINYISNPEIATLTYIALLLVVDIVVFAISQYD